MFDYDEPMYEPSLADEIKTEAADKLFAAVDASVRQRFDKIELDNKSLEKRNKQLLEELSEYKSKESDIEAREKELSRKAKRMSLKEIMGQRKIMMYAARTEYKVKEKCSRCDDNRKLVFISPRGFKMKETCECGENIQFFAPSKQIAYEMADGKESLRMWYSPVSGDKSYSSGVFVPDENVFVGELDDYSNLNKCNSYFVFKKDCQEYCDWLNMQDNKT